MKKLLAMLLAGVLLCMGAACFAGCERNTKEYVNMVVYEIMQPYEYLAELDGWDTVKYAGREPDIPEITVPYDGKARDYKVKIKYEDGRIIDAVTSNGTALYSIDKMWFIKEGSDEMTSFEYVLERGQYCYQFYLHNIAEINAAVKFIGRIHVNVI